MAKRLEKNERQSPKLKAEVENLLKLQDNVIILHKSQKEYIE